MHPDLIVNKTCSLTFNCNGETIIRDATEQCPKDGFKNYIVKDDKK